MTRQQIRVAAQSIFKMRTAKFDRPSQSDLNKRRMIIRKQIEDRRYQLMLNRADDFPLANL